jgi:hypothetical protein
MPQLDTQISQQYKAEVFNCEARFSPFMRSAERSSGDVGPCCFARSSVRGQTGEPISKSEYSSENYSREGWAG